MMIAEGPPLSDPYCIRITCRDRFINGFTILGKQLMFSFRIIFRYGKLHLIKTIRQVKIIFPEFFFPLFHKHLSYLHKKRRVRRQYIGIVFFIKTSPFQMIKLYLRVFLHKGHRYKSGKSRCDGMHIQFSHPI